MLADSDPDVPDDQLNEPFVEGDYDIFPPGYGEDLV